MCLTASLHRELAVTYSSGMDKTQEPISLVEGLNKDLSKLPAVRTTLQVIRASPTHSFSPSLRWPAHFPLHFYSFIGFQNCDIPFSSSWLLVLLSWTPAGSCGGWRLVRAGAASGAGGPARRVTGRASHEVEAACRVC